MEGQLGSQALSIEPCPLLFAPELSFYLYLYRPTTCIDNRTITYAYSDPLAQRIYQIHKLAYGEVLAHDQHSVS